MSFIGSNLMILSKYAPRHFCALAGLISLPGVILAQTITFEAIPGLPVPMDKMAISNQYAAEFGVMFQFEDGTFPLMAKRGGPRTAFEGPNDGNDNSRTNQGCGDFFLTDDGEVGRAPSPLIITYLRPVAAASGVIIDIDGSPPLGGNERWLIEARGTNDVILATERLGPNSFNSGDGLATPWRFKRPTAEIHTIRITYDGAKTNGIGLAFDNFSPATSLVAPALSIIGTQATVKLGISGTIGGSYTLEYTTNSVNTHWLSLTNFVLEQSPEWIEDGSASNVPSRFYRAIGIP